MIRNTLNFFENNKQQIYVFYIYKCNTYIKIHLNYQIKKYENKCLII